MEPVQVAFKKLRDNAVIPKAATEMSGGMDVTVTAIERKSEDEYVVKLGLAMQPPPGYRIRFSPRSSFGKTRWVLQNSPALGDADYQGEYQLRFRAIPSIGVIGGSTYVTLKHDDFPYKVGDRCAQMWIEEIIPVDFVEVDELPNQTDRQGGFGSTGK